MVDPDKLYKETEKAMKAAVEATRHEAAKIRTGRANVAILDGIDVDCYGSKSPIPHVANVTVPEPRTIVIQPYDKSVIKHIETAINKSDLGLTPNNDGTVIRLTLPELNEERRKELVKVVKKIGEEGKVSIRNHRHKANDQAKKAEKDGDIPQDEAKQLQDEVQEMTERFNTEIDKLLADKEEEIMNF
ncbi:MAG: ribosome recycling factor [Candidatus Omnitrophica bacterium]|nr:ribosome recycling factor [Candidatus Omnitrophota bacterium]MCA9417105.1 ribosome recycling factor [Candidatus Omnitrophota bacterium]MCA9428407.1 ribosome recycling factor [Candidatus Omnitrophota bacterium]MCA9431352.1 ribosome recycling factor [Candidatus Omnitrophota bacterium]MCA9440820.1 ribosome recycling factor [Candidatus Omnitrophota bacterium]